MRLQSLPCYCATLRQAARAVTALYEEVLADSDLHATQYTALQVLKIAPNLTTTDLADALGIDRDWLYYLAGRFPEDVRDKKLSEKQVAEAMVAFRGGLRGGPRKGKGRS